MSPKKKKKLSEDEAFEIARKDHPEYRREWEEGELPEEIVDKQGNVISPHAHLAMHAIVERQIANDDPPGVAAIAQELEDLGLSRHDVRHGIAQVVSEQMWLMMKENQVFDEKRYFQQLRAFVQSQRGRRS